MSANRWKGAAAAVAQLNTATVGGTAANGQVYTVTAGLNNSKTVSYTASGVDTNTTIAAALLALLQASTVAPEFQEMTWANPSAGVLTAAAKTPGQPFTFTTSATGTGTFVTVITTASTGPNNWDNAANWSLNAVPAAGDDVYVDAGSVSILYGLGQSGVTLNSLTIAAAYTGQVGLPETNTTFSSGGSYLEYRGRYLQVGATTAYVGAGQGQGSQLLNLDAGAVQTSLVVYSTGASQTPGLETLQWKGTSAANVVTVQAGSVALAGYGGDLATLATLNVGFVTSPSSDAQVRAGVGCTLTTLDMSGGVVDLYNGPTTVSKQNGDLTLRTGNVTTITDDGGATHYRGVGTVTTWNVGSAATADFSQDMRARTVTTLNCYKGATVSDPFGTVAVTNPLHAIRCRIADLSLDFGENRSILIS